MSDSVDGLGPLWIFFIGSMAIVGVVTLAALVKSWWILAPAMIVFFASASGVIFTIMHQLKNEG